MTTQRTPWVFFISLIPQTVCPSPRLQLPNCQQVQTKKKSQKKKKKKERKEKEKQSFISPNKDLGKESLARRLIPVAAVGSSAYGSFTSWAGREKTICLHASRKHANSNCRIWSTLSITAELGKTKTLHIKRQQMSPSTYNGNASWPSVSQFSTEMENAAQHQCFLILHSPAASNLGPVGPGLPSNGLKAAQAMCLLGLYSVAGGEKGQDLLTFHLDPWLWPSTQWQRAPHPWLKYQR